MAKTWKQRIEEKIAGLELEQAGKIKSVKDLDQELSDLNQELSKKIREKRVERERAAFAALQNQQAIASLRQLIEESE